MGILDKDVSELKEGSLDLRSTCPISYLLAFKRASSLFLVFLTILGFSMGLFYIIESSVSEEVLVKMQTVASILVITSFLAAIGRFFFELIEMRHYFYGIEAGHLVLVKGIILKRRGSFPLSRITDVYLDRTFTDFLFGLYTLHISTPTMTSGHFARIDGLTRKSALRLQESLTDCLDSPIDVEMGSHGKAQSAANERRQRKEQERETH